jgi:inosine-uridine nucleoside N-ribohydrolase
MAICMALEQHRRGKIEILAISLVCGNTTINYQKINILRILKLFPDIYGKVRSQELH